MYVVQIKLFMALIYASCACAVKP